MKNIVAKLTLRQLKLNFRRTLISIIGIALSATMLTATASLVTSFLDGTRRAEINDNGEWHMRINEMPYKNYDKIKETIPNVEETLLLEWDGFAPIPQKGNKRFFYIESYGKETFEHFPVILSEGRLPEKDGELLISEAAAASGYKTGQSFTLDLGYRSQLYKPDSPMCTDGKPFEPHLPFSEAYEEENNVAYEEQFHKTNSKTYTIVGVFKDRARYYTTADPAAPAFEAISFLDPATIKADDSISPLLLFKHPTPDIYFTTEGGCKALGGKNVSDNSQLLQYYGVSRRDGVTKAIFAFAAVLILVIIIGSVSFIYNAFSISLADRSRYLGMLACVGATKKQKKFSVFLEGAVLGAISIPLGLLLGLGGIAIALKIVNPYLQQFVMTTADFHLVVHPVTIISAVLLGILTIAISLWKPAKIASKTSPIDAIRSSNEITVTKKQVKTSRLTKKLFGFEGELAMKNIKRNKGRYKITVASLTVSVILFLVTVGGVQLAQDAFAKEMGLANDTYNARIYTHYSSSSSGEKAAMKKLFDEISQSPDTKKIMFTENMDADISVKSDSVEEKFASSLTPLPDGENSLLRVTVVSLTNKEFDRYLREIGKIPSKFPEDGAVFVNKKYEITYDETDEKIETGYRILKNAPEKTDVYQKGETLKTNENVVSIKDTYTGSDGLKHEIENYYAKTGEIKISAVSEKLPEYVNRAGTYIVVRQNEFDKLHKSLEETKVHTNVNTDLFLISDDTKAACDRGNEIALKENIQLYTYDKVAEMEEVKNLINLVSVFSGGFIALIILICIANIFNTISTGIALRKREFAMLKSTGMTPKAFNRMISYESLFYALKALLYGVPVSMIIAVILKFAIAKIYETTFIAMFPWLALIIAAVSILVLVGGTAFYALRKINNEPIMDVLKDENI